MDKRAQGELLTTIGLPATVGWFGVMGVFSGGGGNPLHLLWAVPLCVVTLPTLPLLLRGEKILRECDMEDFQKQTHDLPHIKLPEDSAWLDMAEDGTTFIGPSYENEFANETLARMWLHSNGYQEVVALDYPNSTGTWWVKQENING